MCPRRSPAESTHARGGWGVAAMVWVMVWAGLRVRVKSDAQAAQVRAALTRPFSRRCASTCSTTRPTRRTSPPKPRARHRRGRHRTCHRPQRYRWTCHRLRNTRQHAVRVWVPDVGSSMARTDFIKLVDLALEEFDVGGVRNDAFDDRLEGLVRRVPRVLVLTLAQNVLTLEGLSVGAEVLQNGRDHRVLHIVEELGRIRERLEEGGHDVRALVRSLLHFAMRRCGS